MIQQRKIVHPEYYRAPYTTVLRPVAPQDEVSEKLLLAVIATYKTRKAVRIPHAWMQKYPVWNSWVRMALARRGYRVRTLTHERDFYVWIDGPRPRQKRKPRQKAK